MVTQDNIKDFIHCGFLELGNTHKILTEIWHQIRDKNDSETICHLNYFQIPQALLELPANQPLWLNWLGQLAGNSERARGILN